jgi:hypothetical protein
LEVLALGTEETPEDGLEFAEALGKASEHAAFACVPWGFGKWWFARGTEVRAALDSEAGNVCLGENAGRPWPAPIPRPFELARRERVPILPGSDPLPLAWHWNRAGRLAFSVPGTPDPDRPLRSLVEAVGRGAPIETLGRRTSLGGFLIDQIALRLTRPRNRAR